MRKISIIFVAVVLALSVTSSVFAAGMKERFNEGADLFIHSPLHVSSYVVEEYKAAEFKPFGIVGGVAKGFAYFVIDAGHGLFKMLTFNVEPLFSK